MNKPNIKVTKNQLIGIAIQSVRERQNLSMFWEYVGAARTTGILDIPRDQIDRLLQEHDLLVHSKGFSLREYDESLSNKVSTYELGAFISAERPIPYHEPREVVLGESIVGELISKMYQRTDIPEKALSRAEKLVEHIAGEFGWRKDSSSPIYHQDELGVHVYGGKHIRVIVVGMKGVARPCFSYDSQYTIKDDAVAALLIACLTEEQMINHIEKFSPGYISRLEKFMKGGNRG